MASNGASSPAPGAGIAERAAAGRDEYGRFDPALAAAAAVRSPRAGKLASPVARRMAARHGVDLEAVEGLGDAAAASARPTSGRRSSSGGAQTPARAAGPSLGADGLPAGLRGRPARGRRDTRVRRLIAEHMVRSRQTAAHMTTDVDVDLSAVIRARTELNEARLAAGASKLSFLPFIAPRRLRRTRQEHPGPQRDLPRRADGPLAGGQPRGRRRHPRGLLVPVIRGCERLTAPTIGDAIADLAERARSRRLVPDDLAGGTFTLSNPGSVGAVSAPAIINQPQVAILGVPAIQRRPWVIADEYGEEAIAIRSILRLAVTFDHRAVDGAGATRFAVAVKDRLEDWGPETYT